MLDLNSYGKIVSFDVYAISILGNNYRTVKILSIIDYDTARLISDPANTAVSVYPSLPKGTPKDYKKYKYVKIEHANKMISCIALEWINLQTIIFHTDIVATVKIKLANVETIDTLRRLLIANNLPPLEINID